MSRVKVRHHVVKRGHAFWQPTKKMRALGFFSVPLGQDGPDAWARAEQWNDRWDKTRRGNDRWDKTRRGEAPSPAMVAADNLSPERSEELTVYPSRALGEAFRRYRRTDEWAGKALRTREDWWRGWKRGQHAVGVQRSVRDLCPDQRRHLAQRDGGAPSRAPETAMRTKPVQKSWNETVRKVGTGRTGPNCKSRSLANSIH